MSTNFDDPVEFLRNRFEQVLLPSVFYTSDKPIHKSVKSEASVLILLDRRDDEWYVFLTQRSDNLRSYAGEVSFPGGKRETDDQSFVETALREAHEETGLPFQNVEVLGACLPILSKLQVLVHPVFGYLKQEFEPEPNDEVQKCFWLPLKYFLLKDYHTVVTIAHQRFRMHKFDFPEDVVYGLTAHLCVLTAMLVLNEYPEFMFLKNGMVIGERLESIPQFVKKHLKIEFKENMDFVLDLQEYLQMGKRGKM